MKMCRALAADIIFIAAILTAQPASYTAVEVDLFSADRNIAFPADYQMTLEDDIAREISVAFPALIILRQGDPIPDGQRILRISGTVVRFKPGNRAKRYFIGFGAGATVVKAQVRFGDTGTRQVVMIREVEGITWTGVAGGDSQAAANSLAKKIAKLLNAEHLVASN